MTIIFLHEKNFFINLKVTVPCVEQSLCAISIFYSFLDIELSLNWLKSLINIKTLQLIKGIAHKVQNKTKHKKTVSVR